MLFYDKRFDYDKVFTEKDKTLSKQNEKYLRSTHSQKPNREEKPNGTKKKTIVEAYGAVVILKLYKKQKQTRKNTCFEASRRPIMEATAHSRS